MEDIVKLHEDLEKRIIATQQALRIYDEDNPLLGLVTVDEVGIQYTEEFVARYEGVTTYVGMQAYLFELYREFEKKHQEVSQKPYH